MSVMGNVTTLPAGLVPTLDLDFLEQRYRVAGREVNFSDVVDFTRNGVGYFIDRDGKEKPAAANIPRFAFDPLNNSPCGLLLEEQRTNLLRQSTVFESTLWTKASGVSLSMDGTLSRSGVPMRLVTLSRTDGHQIIQSLSSALVVGVSYTLSLTMMAATTPFPVQIAYYDMSNSLNSVGLTPKAGVVQRFSFTFTPTVTAAAPQIRLIGFAGGSDKAQLYIGEVGLEVGAFATSTIPTSTAQVTRAADVGSLNLDSSWFNPAAGTLLAEFLPFEPNAVAMSRGIASFFTNGSADGRLTIFKQSASGRNSWYNKPGTPDRTGATIVSDGVVRRAVMSYTSVGGRSISVNGSAVEIASVSNGPDMNSLTTLGLMRAYGTTNELYSGYLRRLIYCPVALPSPQLQELTR